MDSLPILCPTCLGDNPYVRMMKETYGSECKICQRPFTTFRWCPGHKMRYKKTEICQTCSRAKNVCQTCLLDLVYGLPVQVRDNLLNINQEIPKNEVNREYFNQNLDRQIQKADASEAWGPHKSAPTSDILMKIARHSPYYKRNRSHICSFWVKGECKRGEECPYRHEKPTDPEDPLSDQNIKDRYFGSNDPVAEKLLKRVSEMPKPVPPEDKTITTIYIGNVGEVIVEKDLRDYFEQFGQIRTISMIKKQNCVFITYTTRNAAELAVEKSYLNLVIHNQKLSIRWGKSLAKRNLDENEVDKSIKLLPVPGLPSGTPDYFNLKGSIPLPSLVNEASDNNQQIYYPSQDPNRLGTYKINNQS